MQFGFGQLGLHRIYATFDSKNVTSARVLEKLSVRLTGRLRDRWCDSLLYAILEDDW